MSVTPEMHQPAMAPYFAVAASASESYSLAAAFRSALLVKVWPVQAATGGGGDGDRGRGLGGGGEGEGGGGEGLSGGGKGLGGGGEGEGGGGEGEGDCGQNWQQLPPASRPSASI